MSYIWKFECKYTMGVIRISQIIHCILLDTFVGYVQHFRLRLLVARCQIFMNRRFIAFQRRLITYAVCWTINISLSHYLRRTAYQFSSLSAQVSYVHIGSNLSKARYKSR